MARFFSGAALTYLNVGDVADLDITGTAITVSAWVFATDITSIHHVAAKYDPGGNQRSYRLATTNTGLPFFAVSDGVNVSSAQAAVAISTAGWVHLCGMQDATDIYLFSNGVQAATNPTERILTNVSAPFRIGVQSEGSQPWQGSIAEVAVWNDSLSVAEIQMLAAGSLPFQIRLAKLCGYWPICGLSSPEPDLSRGNSATVTGDVPGVAHPFTSPYCDARRTNNPAALLLGRGSAW